MVVGFLILIISCIASMEAWEVLNFKDYTLIETGNPDARDKFKARFPETPRAGCETMHETFIAPFTAIVLYQTSGRLICMGTIVDTCHILTAKRCYEKADVKDLLVLVGYYKAYWGRNAQVLPVKRIIRHEYQLALLRLSKPIKFTLYIQAVKLPTAFSRLFIFEKLFPPPYKTLGFPVDRYDVPGDYVGKDKMYTLNDETEYDLKKCTANFTKLVLDESKVFCTRPNGSENNPFCWGAWGGAILKPMSRGFLLQVGVVVADNCSEETTGPLLAVRTDVYGDWIRGNSYRGHQAS